MEFPVVSTRGNLELEVMSRAPLFGGDTRLGYISLSLDDITSPVAVLTTGPGDSQLAYRCEPLLGAQKGELVLIMDYKKLQAVRRRLSCGAFGNSLLRRAAQFRAFFLYHYWPCDKSIFQMYMHEPIDICLLLLSLSPFVFVRVLFYTVLLLCLCFPWPPDEHQIVQFILACKGTAIISDGAKHSAVSSFKNSPWFVAVSALKMLRLGVSSTAFSCTTSVPGRAHALRVVLRERV